MVHLLYVFRNTQPEDGGIYTKKAKRGRIIYKATEAATAAAASPPRHHKEHDNPPTSHLQNRIPAIHIRLYKPRQPHTCLP